MRIRWLTSQIVAHRRLLLILVGFVTLAAISVMPTLTYEQDLRYLFRTAASNAAEDKSEGDIVVILIGADSIIRPDIIEKTRSLVQTLENMDSVDRVTSMLDARQPRRFRQFFLRVFPDEMESERELERVRQRVERHPLLQDRLVSSDGKWTRIIVALSTTPQTVEDLRRTVEPIREAARLSLLDQGAQVFVTGLPAMQLEAFESLRRDQRLYTIGGALVGFAMSFLIFRNWKTVCVVISGPFIGLIWTFGLMAAIGEPINPLNVVVAPLVMTIALTNAVHIQMRNAKLRAASQGPVEAIVEAMHEVAPACVLTSLTTMIGFGSLASAQLITIQRFGILCAVSIGLALLPVLILVPALSTGFFQAKPGTTNRRAPRGLNSLLSRVADIPVVHPGKVVVVGVALTAAMFSGALQLRPAISMSDGLPRSAETSRALRIADEHFGGTLPMRVVISWSQNEPPAALVILSVVRELEQFMEAEGSLGKPLSIIDLLRSLPRENQPLPERLGELRYVPGEYLSQFLRPDGAATYISTWVPDAGSEVLAPALDRLDRKLSMLGEKHPSLQFSLEDQDLTPIRLGNTLIFDLLRSLFWAIILCTLAVTIGLRSIRLGALALLPNAIPLTGVASLMLLFGLPLELTSATVFTVALGVAVDDTIHLLRRYRLLEHLAPNRKVRVRHTIRQVGAPICLTTLILVAGLSVVLGSEIPALFRFGWLFIAALLWAILGDLVLLPAMLIFLGRSR